MGNTSAGRIVSWFYFTLSLLLLDSPNNYAHAWQKISHLSQYSHIGVGQEKTSSVIGPWIQQLPNTESKPELTL